MRDHHCTKCEKLLTSENAYPSKASAFGLQSKCMACEKVYHSRWHAPVFTVPRLRRATTVCRICGDLPHRGKGQICACGLKYKAETLPELKAWGSQWVANSEGRV
jgi:hypothetical protein